MSIFSSFPRKIWLSISAHKRLFAAVIACRSPVKCKLISDMGTTCAYPPPAAPPLIPNTGPSDGSRSARHAFFPIFESPSASPIETVVFPSPEAVGLIAVTKMSLALRFASLGKTTFALYLPYNSSSFSVKPSVFATSRMSLSFALSAISISESIAQFLHCKFLFILLYHIFQKKGIVLPRFF